MNNTPNVGFDLNLTSVFIQLEVMYTLNILKSQYIQRILHVIHYVKLSVIVYVEIINVKLKHCIFIG